MSAKDRSLNIGDSDSDLAQFLTSKSYVPNEMYMPKTSVIKSVDPDINYLLSKLSDQDLLKLLNEQPNNNEYELGDAIKLASNSKMIMDESEMKVKTNPSFTKDDYEDKKHIGQRLEKVVSMDIRPKGPVFRLESKPVKPFNLKKDMNTKSIALQKLKNMLYSRPQENMLGDNDGDDDDKKELLFDVLVAQLKTLCCTKRKPNNNISIIKSRLKSPSLNSHVEQDIQEKSRAFSPSILNSNNEYIFLILNDEIKSGSTEELVPVEPDSLDRNSSVLLLGPITSRLSDSQLKLVMSRISNELSRPEYLPVLQQLSDGTIGDSNAKLVKSLITGPGTRRYIKPHRCNHQSKLARVYGGPKWIICSGYLNLNIPSLYD